MNDWRLRQLPVSARVLLTSFLAMLAAGYGLGVANIYYSHRSADGDQRFSLDDLKAVYSGVQVRMEEGQAAPSRMLEMIDGKMREFLKNESDYQALRAWLAAGSKPEDFEKGMNGGNSPRDILSDNCIRCHNPEGEKGQEDAWKSPFAADLLSAPSLALVSRYTAPPKDEATGKVKTGPQSIERLILVGHTHLLSIPVFTLITSMLVLFTGLRPALRGLLVAGPMLMLLVDFAGWWLARHWAGTVWLIALSGPLFGALFGAQILATLLSMWLGRRSEEAKAPF